MIIKLYHQTGVRRSRKLFKHWKNPGYEKPGATHYFWLVRRWLISITLEK